MNWATIYKKFNKSEDIELKRTRGVVHGFYKWVRPRVLSGPKEGSNVHN